MEVRKNPQVDLDRYRSLFFCVGLVISLSLLLIAFEWKFYDNLPSVELDKTDYPAVAMEELDIPTTVQSLPPPPKTVIEQPDIVEVDNDEIVEELEIHLDADLQEDQELQSTIVGSADGVLDYQAASLPAPIPPPTEEEDEIFLVVEEFPEPHGGIATFYEYVAENLKYPRQARREGIKGKVFLQFIIDKDGSLTNVKVVKGIGFGCDEEAVRVVSSAPRWKPGKQRGKAVKVKMTLPIKFKFVANS